ncbi:MAG: hypothetical protein AB7T63_00230 [Planctomycetota bacterium]
MVWHTHRLLGGRQEDTATRLATMGATKANQTAVSRALRDCKRWIDAGGLVPDPPRKARPPTRRARPMDPSKLERGSSRLPQRPRSDESE